MCRSMRWGKGGFLNIGDLVWFNSGGSSHRALVLGFTRNRWLDHIKEQEMVKVYWLGGKGPRPLMYNTNGSRIYNQVGPEVGECYVAVRTRGGWPVFKVISKA